MRKPAPIRTTQEAAREILQKLDELELSQRELAAALNLNESKISRIRAGERQMKAAEVDLARAFLAEAEVEIDRLVDEYVPAAPPMSAYVPVQILPTFAGMGGGGNGEGEIEVALVPRALVEDVLRGKPSDFLLINVRGDSMEPDFRHDDQLLVDRRDTSPAQPGPFAIWDGEWGEYVVKNVERTRSGELRIFSSNPKYAAESAPTEGTRIIGRPVWFGRRL